MKFYLSLGLSFEEQVRLSQVGGLLGQSVHHMQSRETGWGDVTVFFGMKMERLGGSLSRRAPISRSPGKGRQVPLPSLLTRFCPS